MCAAKIVPLLDTVVMGDGVQITQRSLDRLAMAHDASHYLLVPGTVLTPSTADDVARIFQASHAAGRPITFRSGGTSLSGQGVTGSVLVDARRNFQRIRVLDEGRRVRVQPGATVRRTNAHLARHGTKLGPDPASEIACTIGGIVANNSSGMACGILRNTYRTLDAMVFVLPSGTVIDTADEDADERLRRSEPELHAGLARLRDRLLEDDGAVAEIRRQYSMKNTMGYGLNSFLDHSDPVDILAHLIVGSEGTLAFVAEATFRTVDVAPHAATGLMVFDTLGAATSALPALVATGLATIELLDAESLRVAQRQSGSPLAIATLRVDAQAALLVEFQATTSDALDALVTAAGPVIEGSAIGHPFGFTTDPAERARLWQTRKGLYTAIASARPSGTTALLEDIAVPVDQLLGTCEELITLFNEHRYEGSVIFGHAKDGNIHFMLNERFDDPVLLDRYRAFTEAMVELVLRRGGSLKAEHGTGRVMAPFVRRQYGDALYAVMCEIKRLCDPTGLLNPGVLLSDRAESYLDDLKIVPRIDAEVDRCVECGYCEPACPSKDLTLTPRQRIVVRREREAALARGDDELVAELERDYEYEGMDTCAVDGMCQVACPVDINTGDLVRRLRAESANAVVGKAWSLAADHWAGATRAGAMAMTVAAHTPAPLAVGTTRAARTLLGADTIPQYSKTLPRGGPKRPAPRDMRAPASAVFFAACIGAMFGPTTDSSGATAAFLELCRRADVDVVIPKGLDRMCCGTPWKSKGYLDGYATMASQVLPALAENSRDGEIPIVCDAVSCTEGLVTMQEIAGRQESRYEALTFLDSTQFVAERLLPKLALTSPVESLTLHHTCSSTALGANDAMTAIARFVSPDVHIPIDWGCCAFAGDRGLLHPELTASATSSEAAEISKRTYTAYASANRTCELGMTRATGHEYRHLLEVLEEATRPVTSR